MRSSTVLITTILIVSMVVGCGESGPVLYPVSGTVTVGGKPTEGVAVTFAPTDGRPASAGRTNSAGKFVLLSQSGRAGAVSGKHKVLLSLQPVAESSGGFSDPANIERMAKQRDAAMKSGKKGAPPAPGKGESGTIPPEYSNPGKTPLEYEVKTESNSFDVPVP